MIFELRFKIIIPLIVLYLLIRAYAENKKGGWGTRKVALLGIFTAMCIVIGMVEGMLPDLMIPGMKLGLANVLIMILIYEFSWYEALVVDILRVIIVCLLRGNVFNMPGLMSLSGAVLSYLAMVLVAYLSKKKLSPIFISIVGALFHDVGQILIGILYLSSSAVIYYLPFMVLISLGTGVLSGILAMVLMKTKVIEKQKKLYGDY